MYDDQELHFRHLIGIIHDNERAVKIKPDFPHEEHQGQRESSISVSFVAQFRVAIFR
jgi:hypothetical protein